MQPVELEMKDHRQVAGQGQDEEKQEEPLQRNEELLRKYAELLSGHEELLPGQKELMSKRKAATEQGRSRRGCWSAAERDGLGLDGSSPKVGSEDKLISEIDTKITASR